MIKAGAAALLRTPSIKAVWAGEGLAEDTEWQAGIIARSIQAASYKYTAVPKESSQKGTATNIKNSDLLGS